MVVTMGSHLQGMRWCNARYTSHRWAHLGTKYRDCMGLTDRPLCATNLIHNFLLSCVVGVEKYRCFLGTSHKNCCSLSTQNAEDKRQWGFTKSTRQRFRTQDVSYLKRHLTTWPHEILMGAVQEQRPEKRL